jgi:hypothetical protein
MSTSSESSTTSSTTTTTTISIPKFKDSDDQNKKQYYKDMTDFIASLSFDEMPTRILPSTSTTTTTSSSSSTLNVHNDKKSTATTSSINSNNSSTIIITTTNTILDILNDTLLGTFTNHEYIHARNFFSSFLFTTTTTNNNNNEKTKKKKKNQTQHQQQQQQQQPSVPNNKNTTGMNANINHNNSNNYQYHNKKFHISDPDTHDRIAIGLRLYERLLHELYIIHVNQNNHHTNTSRNSIVDLENPNISSTTTTSSSSSSSSLTTAGMQFIQLQQQWIYDPYQTIIPLLKEWKRQQQKPKQQSRRLNNINNNSSYNNRNNNNPINAVRARHVISTLQRCEEQFILPIQKSQYDTTTTTTINQKNINLPQYWIDPILVPILFEMTLYHNNTPLAAEKFLKFIQERHPSMKMNSLNSTTKNNNDTNTNSATSIDLIATKNDDEKINSSKIDILKESDALSSSSSSETKTKTKEKKKKTTTNDTDSIIIYQFPNEKMCRQLLHAWVNCGCCSISTTSKSITTNVAIHHIQTLMGHMVYNYNMNPSIQYYNGLLKLHAFSSKSISGVESITSSAGVTTKTTNAVNSNNHKEKTATTNENASNTTKEEQEQPPQPQQGRNFGSVHGREHRNKVDTILYTINEMKIQPTLETWYQVVVCYSKWHCLYEAQDIIFSKMIPIVVTAPSDYIDPTRELNDNTIDTEIDNDDTIIFGTLTQNNSNSNENENEIDFKNQTTPLSTILDMACHHVVMAYRRLICIPTSNRISAKPYDTTSTGTAVRADTNTLTNTTTATTTTTTAAAGATNGTNAITVRHIIPIDQKRQLLYRVSHFVESLQNTPYSVSDHGLGEFVYYLRLFFLALP